VRGNSREGKKNQKGGCSLTKADVRRKNNTNSDCQATEEILASLLRTPRHSGRKREKKRNRGGAKTNWGGGGGYFGVCVGYRKSKTGCGPSPQGNNEERGESWEEKWLKLRREDLPREDQPSRGKSPTTTKGHEVGFRNSSAPLVVNLSSAGKVGGFNITYALFGTKKEQSRDEEVFNPGIPTKGGKKTVTRGERGNASGVMFADQKKGFP